MPELRSMQCETQHIIKTTLIFSAPRVWNWRHTSPTAGFVVRLGPTSPESFYAYTDVYEFVSCGFCDKIKSFYGIW